jgi:osmotically-inducible protein OsmY
VSVVSTNPQLIRDVKKRLELDPRVPHPIEVAVSGSYGIVTLRGTDGSLRQRRAAVEDTGSVQGVDEIIDELRSTRWRATVVKPTSCVAWLCRR